MICLILNLQDPPERPRGHKNHPSGMASENYQLWSLSGESCPEGTVPIRRTTEHDMLRASSVRRFGRKLRRHVRRDSSSNGHEVSAQNITFIKNIAKLRIILHQTLLIYSAKSFVGLLKEFT